MGKEYCAIMTLSMDDFIAELRQMVAHWRKDFARLDKRSGNPLIGQIETWIVEAEQIIATHESRNA